MLGQRRLERRSSRARGDADGQRARIDREHAAQARQVQRDHRLLCARDRREPPDDAGAAAERDDGDALLRADREHGQDLFVGGGIDDGVRGPQGRSCAHAHEVEIALAAGVQHARDVVAAHPGGATDALLQALARALRAAPARASTTSASATGSRRLPSRPRRVPSSLAKERVSGSRRSSRPHPHHRISSGSLPGALIGDLAEVTNEQQVLEVRRHRRQVLERLHGLLAPLRVS